ncbi:general substrate transporter [Armillaria borealis]|uniref:General substrate transporter n=1 Tax=Armillaria borealis TaxID=47425 RepID=A0AA39MXV4_9AGAR|nr:general substrate transporter [Armillaria borealis]
MGRRPQYNSQIASTPFIVGSFACIIDRLFDLDISSMSGVLSLGSNAQGAIVAAMPAGSLAILSFSRSFCLISDISAGVPICQSEITVGAVVSVKIGPLLGVFSFSTSFFGYSNIDRVASFRIPRDLQMIPANSPQSAVLFERTNGAKSYLDFLKPGMPRHVAFGVAFLMWSQLNGILVMMWYYIVYVFQGASELVVAGTSFPHLCIESVLNMTFMIPTVIYIEKLGTLLMGFFLFLISGLQSHCGRWAIVSMVNVRIWIIEHTSITYGVIICSCFLVCAFTITMGPISWTYSTEFAVSLAAATSRVFNFALAWEYSRGSVPLRYFIFGTFNFAAFLNFTCSLYIQEIF